MRELLRDPLRIDHMIESIENINSFMQGKTLDDLKNDKLLFFGVVKNIEILGEAANNLSPEFKSKHTDIPWRKISGMRHVLVHDYYQINPEEVFLVYQYDLPELKQKLINLVPPPAHS